MVVQNAESDFINIVSTYLNEYGCGVLINPSVCLSVCCLSAAGPIFTSVQIPCGRYATLCTSGFTDGVTFGRNIMALRGRLDGI